MAKVFTRAGIAFQYPGDWTVEAEDDGAAWSVTLQSPGTAFAVVSLRPEAVGPAEVIDETLAALRTEYKELDAEPVVESLGGLPAVGHDIDFLTLDTGIACWSRCAGTADGNLLAFAQVSELDRARYEPALRTLLRSFTIADE